MTKIITFSLLMTMSIAFAVESDPAKRSYGCLGKTTDCAQMTYHFNDGNNTTYFYQDYAGYWHIYGEEVHNMDESQLSNLLRIADEQQNQSDLNTRTKFNDVSF